MESQPGSSRQSLKDATPQKRQKRSYFTSSEKQMVINVQKYLKETWRTDEYPYRTGINEKTAAILGIGLASIYRIIKEYAPSEEVKSPSKTKKRLTFSEKIDEVDKKAIRKKVHSFFLKGELPTLKKVLQAANEDEELPNFKRSTFQKMLKYLQFKHIKRQRNSAIIDRDDIILWRRNYLRKMKKYRAENRPIFYMDETGVNTEPTIKHTRGRQGPKPPIPKADYLVAIHIVTDTAAKQFVFEVNQYQTLKNERNFENWFQSVVQITDSKTVLVMDNAGYKSKHFKTTPDATWRKVAIQNWLTARGVSFDDRDNKVVLIEKVKSITDRCETNVILKNASIEVLCLPPHVSGLSPIDEFLAVFRKRVAELGAPLYKADAIKILDEEMKLMTAEKWNDIINQVLIEEDKLGKLEGVIDEIIDENMASTDGMDHSASEDSNDSGDEF